MSPMPDMTEAAAEQHVCIDTMIREIHQDLYLEEKLRQESGSPSQSQCLGAQSCPGPTQKCAPLLSVP